MTEAWIEQSLARLESLEAQKNQHEADGQPVPEELAEEIASLYEALESAASDDDDDAAEPPAAAEPAAPVDDPFAQPSSAPVMPAPAQAAPVQTPAPMAASLDDDDFAPKGKGGLIAVAAVVLLGAAGGGYWYMNQSKPEPTPEPAGETKVITASSVPEDTQEPQAAKGGAADKTPGTEIPEGTSAAPKRGNSGGAKRPRPSGNKRPAKDDGRKVKIDNSRDPLAGI